MLQNSAIRTAIETTFLANKPTLPDIANVQFDGLVYTPTPGTAWVRLQVQIDDVLRETINGTEQIGQTSNGMLTLAYHAPIGTGWLVPETWLYAASNIFNEQRLSITDTDSYIEFDAPLFRDAMDDAPWTVFDCTILFRAYQNPTA